MTEQNRWNIRSYWPGINAQILIAAAAGLLLGYWLNGQNAAPQTRDQILYVAGLAGGVF